MMKKYIIFLIFAASSSASLDPTAKGRACSDSGGRGGELGVCLPLSDCPQLWGSVRKKNETVQVCGIQDQTTLVCCVSKPRVSPSQGALALSYGSSSVSSKSDILISQQKCRDYARLVYEGKTEKCMVRPGKKKSGRTSLGEFPHMTSLLSEDEDDQSLLHVCGGSLISERFVLTTAHCLDPSAGLKWALLGSVNISDPKNHGQLIPISQKTPHPDYVYGGPKYSDIGLVLLKRAPILGPLVRPACLPPDGESFASRDLILTGWGSPQFAEDLSSELLKTVLIEAPHYLCNLAYQKSSRSEVTLPLGIHNASMLCAGHPTGKSDACEGDGGGPIQVVSTDPHCTYKIVGITSFGFPCGLGAGPGVYTRVQYFRKWIENIVWRK